MRRQEREDVRPGSGAPDADGGPDGRPAAPSTPCGAAPPHEPAAGPPPPGKWAVLAVAAIGVLMATIDSSIVNISLPAIAADFHRSLTGLVEWVIIAYLIVVAALLITIGRLADLVGHKPIWLGGLVVFTLGSAICGAAPSLGFLVAARAFQGVGGALLMAISPAPSRPPSAAARWASTP